MQRIRNHRQKKHDHKEKEGLANRAVQWLFCYTSRPGQGLERILFKEKGRRQMPEESIAPRNFSEISANLWMPNAFREIGVKELPGHIHHPSILEYHKYTNGKFTADEVPWCSAFVNYVMHRSGFKGTDSALARSWADWGDRIPTPRYGCLAVLSRGSDPKSGHVGFVTREVPFLVEVLGGNQDNQVKLSWFRKDRIIGYRWPLLSDKLGYSS